MRRDALHQPIRRLEWAFLALGFVVLFGLRVAFLPPTLEDIDSINFDLGVHGYFPPAHRPHPPGYPVYMALAGLVHRGIEAHATALGLVSALAGSLTVVPFYLLARHLTTPAAAALACVFTLFAPLVWFNSVRPMSDTVGLLWAITAQWAIVSAFVRSRDLVTPAVWRWLVAGLLAGLATGVRLQNVWLVFPALVYGVYYRRGTRLAALAGFCAGVTAWLVPVSRLSLGFDRLADSFLLMVREAVVSEPLVSNFTLPAAQQALRNVFVDPWMSAPLAAVMLVLALAGTVILAARSARALELTLFLFGPYALYHLVGQATETLRYALPVVPAVALLAATAVTFRALERRVAGLAGLVFVGVSILITVPALEAYHWTPSPSFQAIERVRQYAGQDVLVSGEYLFSRVLPFASPEVEVLPPRPGQEWERIAAYWSEGGDRPILFLTSEEESLLGLAAADRQVRFGEWSWPAAVQPFIRGQRPRFARLVRLDPPRWFAASGFAIAPGAGAADVVSAQDSVLYLRREFGSQSLLIEGTVPRGGRADIGLQLDGTTVERWDVEDRFVLRTVLEPPEGPGPYAQVRLEKNRPVLFGTLDVRPTSLPNISFGAGFHAPERDAEGLTFRWAEPVSQVFVHVPVQGTVLTIEGVFPMELYTPPVELAFRWNGSDLRTVALTEPDFRLELPLAGVPGPAWGELTLTASHSFVPDAINQGGDTRRLAFRLYDVEVRSAPASGPFAAP